MPSSKQPRKDVKRRSKLHLEDLLSKDLQLRQGKIKRLSQNLKIKFAKDRKLFSAHLTRIYHNPSLRDWSKILPKIKQCLYTAVSMTSMQKYLMLGSLSYQSLSQRNMTHRLRHLPPICEREIHETMVSSIMPFRTKLLKILRSHRIFLKRYWTKINQS